MMMMTKAEVPPILLRVREQLTAAADKVANAEEVLKTAKAEQLALEQSAGAEALRSVELESYTYPDGAVLKAEQRVHVNITEENRMAAHQWLIDNGHGAMVRETVTIEMGKANHELVERLKEFCATMFPQYDIEIFGGSAPEPIKDAVAAFVAEAMPQLKVEVNTIVHASTLKSFITKMLARGEEPPPLFGVFAPKIVTVKLPRSKDNETADF